MTLVAGPAWREQLAGLGEDAAAAVLASIGDCREALRRKVLVIVGDEEPADLIHHGLRSAARGEPYWSPGVLRVAQVPDPEAGRPRLTEREEQVARLVLEGCTDKEIAAWLRMSIHTVKAHLRRGAARLGIARRSELAGYVAARSLPA